MAEKTLGRYGISRTAGQDNSGMKMPKQKHRFRVSFTNFAGGTAPDVTLETNTCGKPNVTYEEQQVHSFNSRAYYAGKYEWQAIELVVRDIIDGSVLKAIDDQKNLQFDHSTQVGRNAAASYKFTMKIEALDGTYDSAPLETWTLEGCWLSTVNFGDWDYSSSESSTITMTIRYDNATLEVGNSSAPSTLTS